MDDLFAPPGTPWQPVSPALGTMRRTVLGFWSGALALTLVVAALVLPLPTSLVLLLAAALVGVSLLAWVLIGRNVRAWGYAERDEDLYIKHGTLFRELIVVPYGRMQYVDVKAGPVEQAFGIAGVHLYTASPGTNARIPGLPADEASRLRDRLTDLGHAQAAGL